jgi:ubiquinone/menaquinone biosynthesis C-methylase UbiE
MSFVHAVPDRDTVRRAYDLWSHFYDVVASPWKQGARMQALPALGHGPGRQILDVGIGTGAYFAQVVRAAGPGARVYGVDFSAKMVHCARRRLRRGRDGGGVIEADALTLPFADESFDIVTSSYVLDLMPTEAIECALVEFRRVLRPAGRAVIVNMTKIAAERTTWYERCDRALPPTAQAYLLGGCRPVRLADAIEAAGFSSPQRMVVHQALPSEIIVAIKPTANTT